MTRSIRRLGLVGATLAIVLIAGLNFAALDRQWDVPYIGVQEANAWGHCAKYLCNKGYYDEYGYWHNNWVLGCWYVGPWEALNPCSNTCPGC